jgi:hypothetical protein
MPSMINGQALQPETVRVYCAALGRLKDSPIEYLVGGAYALATYAGIVRDTKDLDIFVRPADCQRVLDLFAGAGFKTELTFPHWLGKIHIDDCLIDIIFSSGNGVATVDDEWFRHSVPAHILDMPVRLCPAEEMLWSKSYIMERERYDGADIHHLLRARASQLDWQRLLRRFGPHWRVLLGHLIFFGFVYPEERTQVPEAAMRELLKRLEPELAVPSGPHVCRGTLVSREQYLTDIEQWGYQDGRQEPRQYMSDADIEHWTAAIEQK